MSGTQTISCGIPTSREKTVLKEGLKLTLTVEECEELPNFHKEWNFIYIFT